MYGRWFRGCGIALLPIILFASACKGKDVVGTQAIDFRLKGVNGGEIAYSELKGKPVILYFFASW